MKTVRDLHYDGDGDLNFTMEEATIENDTEYVIELIKTSCLMTNADGICVGGSYEDEQDAFIDPRETGSIYVSVPYIREAPFGGQLDKITAVVDAVLFRRDFQKMGEGTCSDAGLRNAPLDRYYQVKAWIPVWARPRMRA